MATLEGHDGLYGEVVELLDVGDWPVALISGIKLVMLFHPDWSKSPEECSLDELAAESRLRNGPPLKYGS